VGRLRHWAGVEGREGSQDNAASGLGEFGRKEGRKAGYVLRPPSAEVEIFSPSFNVWGHLLLLALLIIISLVLDDESPPPQRSNQPLIDCLNSQSTVIALRIALNKQQRQREEDLCAPIVLLLYCW